MWRSAGIRIRMDTLGFTILYRIGREMRGGGGRRGGGRGGGGGEDSGCCMIRYGMVRC